jgi:Mycobacterium membrane protein
MAIYKRIAPLLLAMTAIAVASSGTVLADPGNLPYGPDTCLQGFVWREARTGDTVCVTPDVRARTLQENSTPSLNREPNGGASGPDTCKQGFVWREAFDGDTICVTPAERSQTKADNAAAASRRQANAPKPTNPDTPKQTPTNAHNVVLEITGGGTVYSIDIDPGGRVATENSATPFRTNITAESGELVQIVAVGKTGEQGCRITVDGTVVVSQGAGDAHCIYTLP